MEKMLDIVASIEHERQKMRGEIEKLNRKLQSLTRTDPSYLTLGDPQVNPESSSSSSNSDNKIKDARAVPTSKLPGFMRPTVCSRRKSGTRQQIFDEKQLFQARRRRAPANRAKSMTNPMKRGSEYNSDRSISGASCLVGLNMKRSADFETENSIDKSECDIKMVVFSEEKKPTTGYRAASNYYLTQHVKVDKWLQSRESRSIAGVVKNRRIPAVPLLLKQKVNEHNAAESLHLKLNAEDFKITEIDKHYNKQEVSLDEGGSSSSTVEVEMDKAQVSVNNSFTNEDKMLDSEAWFDASPILEDESNHYNAGDDTCFDELGRENMDFTKNDLQAMQMSKECICKYNDPEEESCVSYSSWKLESRNEEMLFDMKMEDKEMGASLNMFKMQRRANPLDLKHRKALFTDHRNQKNTSISIQNVQSDENIQNAGTKSCLRS